MNELQIIKGGIDGVRSTEAPTKESRLDEFSFANPVKRGARISDVDYETNSSSFDKRFSDSDKIQTRLRKRIAELEQENETLRMSLDVTVEK